MKYKTVISIAGVSATKGPREAFYDGFFHELVINGKFAE